MKGRVAMSGNSKSKMKLKTVLARFLILIFLATSCFCLNPVTVQAASGYYVDDTNGNDSRTPAQAMNISTPWKTIQKAASHVSAGDAVYIRGGTYHETVTPSYSGTSGSPITYIAYNNENVTVTGCNLLGKGGWTQDSGNIY